MRLTDAAGTPGLSAGRQQAAPWTACSVTSARFIAPTTSGGSQGSATTPVSRSRGATRAGAERLKASCVATRTTSSAMPIRLRCTLASAGDRAYVPRASTANGERKKMRARNCATAASVVGPTNAPRSARNSPPSETIRTPPVRSASNWSTGIECVITQPPKSSGRARARAKAVAPASIAIVSLAPTRPAARRATRSWLLACASGNAEPRRALGARLAPPWTTRTCPRSSSAWRSRRMVICETRRSRARSAIETKPASRRAERIRARLSAAASYRSVASVMPGPPASPSRRPPRPGGPRPSGPPRPRPPGGRPRAGAGADAEPPRGRERPAGRCPPPPDAVEHHPDGRGARRSRWYADGGQPRHDHLRELRVVEPDDASVLGHTETAVGEPVDHAHRDLVVVGDHPGGRRGEDEVCRSYSCGEPGMEGTELGRGDPQPAAGVAEPPQPDLVGIAVRPREVDQFAVPQSVQMLDGMPGGLVRIGENGGGPVQQAGGGEDPRGIPQCRGGGRRR